MPTLGAVKRENPVPLTFEVFIITSNHKLDEYLIHDINDLAAIKSRFEYIEIPNELAYVRPPNKNVLLFKNLFLANIAMRMEKYKKEKENKKKQEKKDKND